MSAGERELFGSAAIGVRDFRCSGRNGEGDIEVVNGTQLCLVRTGLFGYRARGREHIADANSVLLLREGLEYETRHPDGEADACTVFSLPERSLRALTNTPTISPPYPSPRGRCERSAPTHSASIGPCCASSPRMLAIPTACSSIEERALHIASDLLSSPLPKGPPGRLTRAATRRVHRELAEDAKELIALRLPDRLRLADLAAGARLVAVRAEPPVSRSGKQRAARVRGGSLVMLASEARSLGDLLQLRIVIVRLLCGGARRLG